VLTLLRAALLTDDRYCRSDGSYFGADGSYFGADGSVSQLS
jgi:hypothetical protein